MEGEEEKCELGNRKPSQGSSAIQDSAESFLEMSLAVPH